LKQDIINTSLAGFLKYGIRKMTVQKLVAPLGISTKTVYKYFRDKENLLTQCLEIHYSKLLKEVFSNENKYPNAVQALAGSWKEAIETDFGVNSVFYHDINYYYPALQDKILKKHSEKINGVFIGLIKSGIAQGYFRKDINPPIVLQAIGILYTSLTRTTQFRKFRLSPAALLDQTILVYLRGICTHKGLEEIKSII
jgi:AcrR family transcriptional regulator